MGFATVSYISRVRTLSLFTVGQNCVDPADKHASPLNYTGSPTFTNLNTNCSLLLSHMF